MARTSDLSGSALPADHATRTIQEDGKTYHLDLTDGEAARFDAMVKERETFTAAALKAAGGSAKTAGRAQSRGTRSRGVALATQTAPAKPARQRTPRAGKAAKPAIKSNGAAAIDTSAIRAWGVEQGLLKATSRGRIAADVVAKYREAHTEPQAEAQAS